MTSTTLNYKGGFKAAFSKTFKQQLPGSIVLIVLSIFASIASAAGTIMDNAANIIENTEYSITTESFVLANSFGAVCIIFSLFLAMQMFKEIYSKRACDTFFAMPIKRGEYFSAKYLVGVLFNVLPILLAVGIHSVILLSASTKLITYTIDFPLLLKALLAMIFGVICIYSIFIFCAVLAGRRVHYFFLVAIALIAPMCVTNGIVDSINTIWGAYVRSYPFTIIHPVQNLPLLMFNNLDYEVDTKQFLIIFLVNAVESVALFFGGYFVFKNRKAEIAEFTPAGKVIPFVFLAFVVIAEFMQTSANMKFEYYIPSAIVSAIMATMIFSAVFYKKAFTKNTLITLAVSSVMCIVFAVAVSLPNYTNYVKYVPDIEEVESVELIDGSMEITNFTFYNFYPNPLPSYDFEQSRLYKFTTAENIENAMQLHKKIIDDETIKKGKALNSDTWGDMMEYDYEYENSYDCMIIYHLKNGKTVQRKYAVPVKSISDEMAALMRNEESLSQIGITSIKSDDLLYAVYNSEVYDENSNSERVTRTLTQQEFEGLLNSYKEDLLNNASKAEFLDYLGGYTGYCFDIYSDRYNDVPVDTENADDKPTDARWVYITYFYPNVNSDDREYYKSLSIEELDRLSAENEKYHDNIASDSIYIDPGDKQTYKYAQSIGLVD